jgi:hypothetical protein
MGGDSQYQGLQRVNAHGAVDGELDWHTVRDLLEVSLFILLITD